MTVGPSYIDFAFARSRISITDVLRVLNYAATKRTGKEIRGACPLCNDHSNRVFAAYLDSNRYYCFRCRRSGNAIELWAAVKRTSFRQAALELCRLLHIQIPTRPAAADRSTAGHSQTPHL